MEVTRVSVGESRQLAQFFDTEGKVSTLGKVH